MLNLPLIAKAAFRSLTINRAVSNALYPVAISVPLLSKTQALPIAKQIPRFRSPLGAVSTMMWRGGDEAPPLPKGSAPC